MLILLSVFVRQKVIVTWNVSFIDRASDIKLPDACQLAINWKKDSGFTICQHNIVRFFWRCHGVLVKFNFWSKFHVNIITGSAQEIWKSEIPSSEFCPISGDLDKLVILNLARMYLIIFLNTSKCQDYSFYRWWVIKEKPTECRVKLLSLFTHPD